MVTPVGNQTKAFPVLSVAMSDAVEEERYRRRVDPLDELIWHWGMAYRIWAADGTWYARRNGHGEVMRAADAEHLSFMIRDDYFRRKVSPTAAPAGLPTSSPPGRR
jgi:hypothetical protein